MSDAWYLDAADYYVDPDELADYPLRQGDLIPGPTVGGERWLAAQIVHPTCELPKRAVREIQVARVRPLSDLEDDFQRSLVVAGYREIEGRRRVALASTFFLAPWEPGGEPGFANFRELATVSRAAASKRGRLAAITHDCRLTFIRRYIYFRFRLAFGLDDVRAWEAHRIANDPSFEGPRPAWAG
ncbi:MAG: hypothetical protein GEU88_08365, partial [Solirubrobacterales bacterium]|nr:hypothetical protein [Solirubrobacterales bacterium]